MFYPSCIVSTEWLQGGFESPLSYSSNQITMESSYLFKVYYDKVFILDVFAHTKWEAIEKAFSKFAPSRPLLKREKFKAIIKK